jgi:rubrerythrin
MSYTLNDLIEMAIADEITSQKFYLAGCQKTDDKKIHSFLTSLANDEKDHERILKGVLEMELYDGSLPVNAELLEMGSDAHTTQGDETSENLTLSQVFEIALKKETKAYLVYSHIADKVGDKELKKLFDSLAEQEQFHYKKIEQKFHARTGQMGYEG